MENPEVLADAALSITTAAKNAGFQRKTCWFHAANALKKRIMKSNIQSFVIIENVRFLQCAGNKEEFFQGFSIFF
jgi:hypothetical protein